MLSVVTKWKLRVDWANEAEKYGALALLFKKRNWNRYCSRYVHMNNKFADNFFFFKANIFALI